MSNIEGVNVLKGKALHKHLGVRRREVIDEEFLDSDLPDSFVSRSRVRGSARHVVSGEAMAQLDALIEAHGLRAVLATVRSLCDSRTDNGHEESMDLDELMAAEPANAEWQTVADKLEDIVTARKLPS